jgi:16S rRNA processing protein RimM
MGGAGDRRVVVGRVTGVFGVKGWVRVYSYTDPPANILDYGPWFLGDDGAKPSRVVDGSVHGRGIIARLEGIEDRDRARALIGSSIAVPRAQLGRPQQGSYFWFDLIGLDVVNLAGETLGRVTDLMQTGANDVLVLEGARRRLVPFVDGPVVKSVDLDAGVVTVDWDSDF